MKNLSKKYSQLLFNKEKLMIHLENESYPKIAAERPHKKFSILNKSKFLIKQVYQKGCTQKFYKKKDQNICYTSELS